MDISFTLSRLSEKYNIPLGNMNQIENTILNYVNFTNKFHKMIKNVKTS